MPTEKLASGDAAEIEVEITTDLTTNRTGQPGADVLSTPSLLKLMEMCSIELTDPRLADGHATVGYAVDGLRHMAPTVLGAVEGQVRDHRGHRHPSFLRDRGL